MIDRAKIVADYEQKFATMKVSRAVSVEASAKRILAGKARYQTVEKLTGVPWVFIGALHDREASCDFRGCLHNGDRIIGTGRKTWHDPKGCGPFRTFEESAVDALRREGFLGVPDWSPGVMCYEAERFNGLGYRSHGWDNPYLWGGTQWYRSGKYVRDHVYDPHAVDPQIGIAPILKRVTELDAGAARPVVLSGPLTSADKKVMIQHSRALRWGEWYSSFCEYLGISGTTILTLTGQISGFLTDWRTMAVIGVLGGGYIAMKVSKFNLINAAKDGRYIPSGLVIPAADPPATEEPVEAQEAA